MSMKRLLFYFCLFIGACAFVACSDDDNDEQEQERPPLGTPPVNVFAEKDRELDLKRGDSVTLTILPEYVDLVKEGMGDSNMITLILSDDEGHAISNEFIYVSKTNFPSDAVKYHWLTVRQLNDSVMEYKVDKDYSGDVDHIHASLVLSIGYPHCAGTDVRLVKSH